MQLALNLIDGIADALLNSESVCNQRESTGTEVINPHSLILAARANGRWPSFRRSFHHAFLNVSSRCARSCSMS